MNRAERSFTLLELILVVILIGIMAGVGIPSYQKAVEKNFERKAFISLIALEGAEKIYMAKNNIYWPPTTTVLMRIMHVYQKKKQLLRKNQFQRQNR